MRGVVSLCDCCGLQIEQFESEIESAIAGTKKKRLDKEVC